MALSGTNRLWKLAEAIRDRIVEKGRLMKIKGVNPQKTRKLIFDPLEERQLLSLSVGTVTDILVNTEWQDIRGNSSTGYNDSGDAVVAWTAADRLSNPFYSFLNEKGIDPSSVTKIIYYPNDEYDGEQVNYPNGIDRYYYVETVDEYGDVTQSYVEDLNIYARYLTDEVQVITLPTTKVGDKFYMLYGANEVQRLSFFAATEQYTDTGYYYLDDDGNIIFNQGGTISGTVDLQLFSLQNGEYISFTYQYNQDLLPEENAANLQKAIRRVDPEFAAFEVTAYSDTEFDIVYNYTGNFEKYKGTNVAEMKVAVGTSNFESGFIAGAIVTTLSEPTLITSYSAQTSVATGIVVSSDPLVTAANIQKAFNAASGGNVLYAPTERIWVYDEATHLYISQLTPTKPLSSKGIFKTVDVKVLPVEGSGGTQFYITFTGNSGLSDQQDLLISTNKTQWTGSSDYVKTIKQSSPVFRVNAPEKTEISSYSTESYYKIEVYTKDLSGKISFKSIYNVELPEIVQTGKTNQSRPAVTMDNDGEFTIAWQNSVDDIADTMNTYDIYARRFTVQGIVDDAEYKSLVGFYVDGGWDTGSTYVPVSSNDLFSSYDYGEEIQIVQGVRPLGEEFRVNATTNGAQIDPAIDSDDDGNFVISWTTDGEYESYFGGIVARWYGKDGLSISGEVYVSYIDNYYGTPHFGKSQVTVSPEGYVVITYDWSNSFVYKSVYAPGSTTPFIDENLVSENAYGASVDFDDNGRYVLAYTSTAEEGAWPYYTDVMAQYFMITRSDDGVYSETALTGALMVNNADNSNWSDHDEEDILHCNQSGVSVGMDADGDTFYAFQGFGIDYQSGQQIYTRGDEGDNRWDASRDIYLTLSDFVNNDLIYGEDHAVWVNGKWAYPCKNIDIYQYLPDILERASGYIYDDQGYLIDYNYGSGTDVDTYIRACLVAARKLFEADRLTETDILDKLSRLNAALEYQLQYLRGDSSGILYSRFGHSPRDLTNDDNSNDNTNDDDDSGNETNLMETAFYVNTGFVSGTVNNARDGSNCHFYVLVPFASNLASASLTLYLERLVESRLVGAEVSVQVDAALYADTNIFDQGLFAENLASNLNDIAKYNTGWDGSFVVNVISDINYYNGTEYEFPYYFSNADYAVFEVICQQGVHDTPMQIWTTGSSKAVNTADGEAYINVITSQRGDYGKKQINAQTSMSSSGNVVVTWQNQADKSSYYYYNSSDGGEYAVLGNPETILSEQIYIRSFKESTDTAGAKVTQVALADGSRIEDGDTLTSAIKNLVVTFDEELMTTETYTNAYGQLHSVDNINNWVLRRDGIIITNAIESIQFGFSATKDLAKNATDPRVNKSVLTLGTNKWEAIVTFADGYEPTSGTYTLALKNAVQDTSRNAMYSNGLRREGRNYEISFQVMPLNEPLGFEEFEAPQSPEQSLTDSTTANQVTRSDITSGLSADSPNTATAVTSDANGNFVSVWTSEGEGIYAAVYRQYYILDATRQRVLKSEEIAKFLVAKDGQTYSESEYTDLKQASVAIDDLGRFMVVWDALDANGDRNVYARHFHFDSVGTITSLDINDFVTTDTNPFRVNIETEEAQQNAAIAMDSDGDIAIVWESYEQDGSGWGIIGRRFYTDNKECVSFGRTNAQQLVTIGGIVETGASSYTISGVVNGIAFTTDPIPLYQGTARNIDAIREALLDVTYTNNQGQEVNVFELGDFYISAYSSNQLLIDFAGKYAYNNIDTFYGEIISGMNTIDFSLINNGAAGAEFVVNETTANNQRFAAVGMNSDGSFVVSWTSWGQDQDEWYESNIYAKQFVSNHSLRNTSTVISTFNASLSDRITPTMIVNDEDVSQYEITDTSYAGVVQVLIGGTDDNTNNDDTNNDNDNADTSLNGTGTLLLSGCHILTAAHVVWDEAAAEAYDPSDVFIKFELEDGIVKYYEAATIYVHPSYMGNVTTDVDLAIIQLREVAPEGVQGYDINRDSDELGQVFTKIGYGYAGQGDDTTDELAQRTYGDKVRGQNVYEVTGSDVNAFYRTSGLVAYDFDDGTRKNDYFGNNLGIRDLGLGKTEAIAAPGDSGGPSFINGKIAGVTSFLVGTAANNDETYGPTAGALGIDVRVSTHSDWIDSILVGGMGTEFLVSTDVNNTVLIDSTDDDDDDDDTTVVIIDNNDVAQDGDQIWSSVAIDSSGNFVISWTGYAQDANGDANTGTTANGLGAIYARRYFNAGASTILTGPVFLVNDYTENDQVHSQVVMSSSGDFTIVWESYQDNQYLNDVTRTDPPTSYGIYAKRFINTDVYIDALVALNTSTITDDDTTNNNDNTNTTAIGDDNNNDDNNNDDNNNDDNNNDNADDETPIMAIFPTIPGGTTSLTIENVGTVGLDGERGSEFRINQTILANQLGGSVAMNNNGDIIFVWTDAYDQNLQGDVQYVIEWTGLNKVNSQNFYKLTLTIGDEVYSANVQLKNNAADTTQAVIDALYDNLIDSDGNVVALFDRNTGDLDKSYSENGKTIIVFSSESVQPDYLTGIMSPEMLGINATVSKTSYTQVRYRTIILSSDNMPPYVTAVDANYTVDSVEKSISLFNSKVIFAEDCGPISLTYDFSELMNSTNFMNYLRTLDSINHFEADLYISQSGQWDTGSKSVLNVSNWTLLKDGIAVTSSYIKSLAYDTSTGLLTMTFTQQLGKGAYILTLKDNVTDLFNNKLDGDYDYIAGGSFTVRFNVGISVSGGSEDDSELKEDLVYSNRYYGHSQPAVASRSYTTYDPKDWTKTITSTEFIVVSTVSYTDLDTTNNDNTNDNNNTDDNSDDTDNTNNEYSDIVIRKYIQEDGQFIPAGTETIVNVYTNGNQMSPDVAMSDYGDYVVVWTGTGRESQMGAFARFYPDGSAQAVQVFISSADRLCYDAKVTIDSDLGLVLVTWREGSKNYTIEGDKILGRYYNLSGKALGDQFELLNEGIFSVVDYDIDSTNVDGRDTFVVTWSVLNAESRYDKDVYAKSFETSPVYTPIDTLAKFRVNQTLSGAQYDPQIAVETDGDFHIVWVNTLDGSTDIYGRSYRSNGTSKTLLGTTNEVLINVTTANRQFEPALSVSPDGGGLVVTYTSFDSEPYNYDEDANRNLHDESILARVLTLNASTDSFVAIDNMTLNAMVSYLTLSPNAANQNGEFLVNQYYNNDQYESAVSVYGCGSITDGTTSIPLFVTAWTGPNPLYGSDLADDDNNNNNDDNNNNNNDNNNNDTNDNDDDANYSPTNKDVYFMTFPTSTFGNGSTVPKVEDGVVYLTTVSRFNENDDDIQSGANGFYRPVETSSDSSGNVVDTTTAYIISGTNGDDVLSVSFTNSGWDIKLNGIQIGVPSGTKEIAFNGLNGSDKVQFTGTKRAETVVINAATGTASFAGTFADGSEFTLSASKIENVFVDGQAGSDSVTLHTSRGNDTIIAELATVELVSAEFEAEVLNFEKVGFRSTAGFDHLLLKDSEEDDVLTLGNNYAKLVAADYTFEAKGFSSVKAVSTSGNDFVSASGVTSLYSIVGAVIAQTANSTNTIVGFDAVSANAMAASSATIFGSTGNDIYRSLTDSSEFFYSDQTKLTMSGFKSVAIYGNGGYDVAVMSSGNQNAKFIGKEKECQFGNSNFSNILNNFSHVIATGLEDAFLEATLYDTTGNDTLIKKDSSAVMKVNDNDLYSLLAFDVVKTQNDKGLGTDVIFDDDEWNVWE